MGELSGEPECPRCARDDVVHASAVTKERIVVVELPLTGPPDGVAVSVDLPHEHRILSMHQYDISSSVCVLQDAEWLWIDR